MFDSVLGHGIVPKSRFGTGAVVSVLLHVGVLGLAIYLSTRPPPSKEKAVAVVLKVAPPPPPPPPPPAASSKQVKHKTNQIVQPKEIPQEKPQEAEPKPNEPAEPEGVPGGVEGGVVGGVLGGVVGGTGTISFGEGMTRPEVLPGQSAAPDYTREALEAHVEGLVIVKCIINTDGRLSNCQIIKPLPHMDSAILEWLAERKYSPVTFQGKPVRVSYVFNFRLKMPR
jgi:periplasmic protein TonB